MMTVQHNRARQGAFSRATHALLALMLLATLLWPAAAQAQDSTTPVTLPPDPRPVAPMGSPDPDAATYAQMAADDAAAAAAADAALPDATFRTLLPYTFNDHAPQMADRLGYGAGTRPILTFPEVRTLNAGWYVNWAVRGNPQRPNGMQFAQMIRVHQRLTCGTGVTADRTICPYVTPYVYDTIPSKADIALIAQRPAIKGSLWLIGNEMDRVDWDGGRQDEMLPEVYAQAYHELSTIIRQNDPTAKVAIGGIIQFTPLREQYLNKVWDAYKARYGKEMQVDVWNVHNFIGPEFCQMEQRNGRQERICYGMAIPPGVPVTPNALKQEVGAYVGQDWKVISREVFTKQIEDFRQWMVGKGQKNKPLIVSEYGVLWPSLCGPEWTQDQCRTKWGANYVDLTDPAEIHSFMLWSFDYFRTAKNCTLSGVDDCRLVQQWAWFGLDDVDWGFNPHAVLMDKVSNQLTPAGRLFADYARRYSTELQLP
jgi:hypothetical protein